MILKTTFVYVNFNFALCLWFKFFYLTNWWHSFIISTNTEKFYQNKNFSLQFLSNLGCKMSSAGRNENGHAVAVKQEPDAGKNSSLNKV